MNRIYVLLTLILCVSSIQGQNSTMTFASGASHSGFNLSRWSHAGGVIFMSNLANPSTISVNSGVWNLVSFDTAPFGSSGDFEATSNLGNSYTFNPNSGGAATHTLNWNGITTLTITRTDPGAGSYDFDDVVYSTGVLPVQFNSFTAEKIEQQVMLEWTALENGVEATYQVERSDNGEAFYPVVELAAQGKMGEPATYYWVDDQIFASKHFFRIKQIDFDGAYTYSLVVEVSTNIPTSLKCWPNPTENHLHVEGVTGQLTLYNTAGEIVLQQPVGMLKETLELQELPAGLYQLSIVNEEGLRVGERVLKL